MDALIAAAARALAGGDAIGALQRVALRDDPPALALRGTAMAQLGELPRARVLLRRAARGFGAREPLSQARCVVAEAEVALAMREFGGAPRTLAVAAEALAARGDAANARHARLIGVRRLLRLGRLADAAAALAALDAQGPAPTPTLAAIAGLAAAELALRRPDTAAARAALDRAEAAAARAGVPALQAEVAALRELLDRPAARQVGPGGERLLRLEDAEALFASGALVVDGCRRGLHRGDGWRPLARRPVLFTLARLLAEAWPGEVDRVRLIEGAFRLREPDETHRARLRVEIGRLRALLRPAARIDATPRGFVLVAEAGHEVVLLAPPIDGDAGALQALLADGAAWSTSALALALDASQRSVQRALAELTAAGRVRAVGRSRAQRWLAPPPAGFTTILLLPAAQPAA